MLHVHCFYTNSFAFVIPSVFAFDQGTLIATQLPKTMFFFFHVFAIKTSRKSVPGDSMCFSKKIIPFTRIGQAHRPRIDLGKLRARNKGAKFAHLGLAECESQRCLVGLKLRLVDGFSIVLWCFLWSFYDSYYDGFINYVVFFSWFYDGLIPEQKWKHHANHAFSVFWRSFVETPPGQLGEEL